ncbi:MAG: hypothetical protein DWP94_08290 [Flavobacterium sp.]|nr:MAG: hypothetical protein DWP94_08290 [Flavobacterium sp.]
MELQLKIIGTLLMLLALIHIPFPRYFKWKDELKGLSLMNNQMMRVHTFFIALTVFLMGLLCFTSASELVHTSLGRKISLGIGIFWTIRLFIQLFVYSSKLWWGKVFETAMHLIFTLLWVYLSFVFLKVYFMPAV